LNAEDSDARRTALALALAAGLAPLSENVSEGQVNLLVARGARFVEVPIDWSDVGKSKVRFGVDPLRMLLALRRIRARRW
jgi:hypothetical protein